MAECSSTESGVVGASRRSTRHKLLEKEVESASKQSRMDITQYETNDGEISKCRSNHSSSSPSHETKTPSKEGENKQFEGIRVHKR